MLQAGGSTRAQVTVVNRSTRNGVPVAVTLAVTTQAYLSGASYYQLLQRGELLGFAAGETKTLTYDMSIPAGTEGYSGLAQVTVFSPDGTNMLAADYKVLEVAAAAPVTPPPTPPPVDVYEDLRPLVADVAPARVTNIWASGDLNWPPGNQWGSVYIGNTSYGFSFGGWSTDINYSSTVAFMKQRIVAGLDDYNLAVTIGQLAIMRRLRLPGT